jgi:hypothetical protein
MPKKKKKKKKSSTSKQLYADYRASGAELKAKPRGFNKLLHIMRKDAGKGMENFDKPVYVNVFEEGKKVTNYKQLERFIEQYIPSMSAADVAAAALNHAKDKWNVVKILKDPEHHGAVFQLLDYIDKNTAKKTYDSEKLVRFIGYTGYKKPKTIKTFQEHITMFKNHFGIKRPKKKVPLFKDKEFKI